MAEIETMNKYLVASVKGGVIIGNPSRAVLTPDDALLLAAWLVAIADGEGTHKFEDVLNAVQST